MPVVPSFLTESEYSAVARNMLLGNPELLSATIDVSVGDEAEQLLPWTYDTSFARQMNDLNKLGSSAQSVPDIYAVTLNSAVPVSDSIRGYHKQLEQACPPIIGIDANSVDGFRFFLGEKQRQLSARQRSHVAELALAGTKDAYVCLVDQYVVSGRTIAIAAEMLYASGAGQVTAIRGKWYTDAMKPPKKAEIQSLTSRHASFMHDVGRLAATHSLAPIS